MQKLLTLKQLAMFCEQRQIYSFNANDSGYCISVQIPGQFEAETQDEYPGLLRVKLKVCHTELNRNKSYISEDNMKKAMPTLKYRPILAHIHQLDNGEWEFHGHDMEISEDENGEEQFEYIEKQVGAFTADDPVLEYDKEYDKTYVVAYGVIPEEYTKAAEIIRRKNGTKVSCELTVNTFQYNAKEKYLEIIDFYFSGCTLLGSEKDGTEIGEGMLGSRLDIADFSVENNSVVKYAGQNLDRQLIETLEKLNTTLSNFNTYQSASSTVGKDGEKVKLNELLEKYGKTVEDITFDYENMSDEELEAAFKEAFEESAKPVEPATAEPTPAEPETNFEGNTEGENEGNTEGENEPTTEPEGNATFTKTFELSHEDIRVALYALLEPYEGTDNEWYWICNVYDTYFDYENWSGEVVYRQNYVKDGDNVAFEGERIHMNRELLTDSEYAALQEMRSNYAQMQSELNQYKAAEEESKIQGAFAASEYAPIIDTDEVKALKENHKDMTFEVVVSKLDAALLKYAKNGGKFAATGEGEPEQKKKVATHIFGMGKAAKKDRYGGIFAEK